MQKSHKYHIIKCEQPHALSQDLEVCRIMGLICHPGENLPKWANFPGLFIVKEEKNVAPTWYMHLFPSWNASTHKKLFGKLQLLFIWDQESLEQGYAPWASCARLKHHGARSGIIKMQIRNRVCWKISYWDFRLVEEDRWNLELWRTGGLGGTIWHLRRKRQTISRRRPRPRENWVEMNLTTTDSRLRGILINIEHHLREVLWEWIDLWHPQTL